MVRHTTLQLQNIKQPVSVYESEGICPTTCLWCGKQKFISVTLSLRIYLWSQITVICELLLLILSQFWRDIAILEEASLKIEIDIISIHPASQNPHLSYNFFLKLASKALHHHPALTAQHRLLSCSCRSRKRKAVIYKAVTVESWKSNM